MKMGTKGNRSNSVCVCLQLLQIVQFAPCETVHHVLSDETPSGPAYWHGHLPCHGTTQCQYTAHVDRYLPAISSDALSGALEVVCPVLIVFNVFIALMSLPNSSFDLYLSISVYPYIFHQFNSGQDDQFGLFFQIQEAVA